MSEVVQHEVAAEGSPEILPGARAVGVLQEEDPTDGIEGILLDVACRPCSNQALKRAVSTAANTNHPVGRDGVDQGPAIAGIGHVPHALQAA